MALDEAARDDVLAELERFAAGGRGLPDLVEPPVSPRPRTTGGRTSRRGSHLGPHGPGAGGSDSLSPVRKGLCALALFVIPINACGGGGGGGDDDDSKASGGSHSGAGSGGSGGSSASGGSSGSSGSSASGGSGGARAGSNGGGTAGKSDATGAGEGGDGAGSGGSDAGNAGTGGSSGNDDVEPCPTGNFENCATDCSGRSSSCQPSGMPGCYYTKIGPPGGVVRTPSAADACFSCGGTVAAVQVNMLEGIYRVTVSPPWSLIPPPVSGQECSAGKQCIINGYSGTSYGSFLAVTSDLNASPHNILIEEVPADVEGCP
jgi:hypothetical protein